MLRVGAPYLVTSAQWHFEQAGYGFDLKKIYTIEEEKSGLAWIRHGDTILLGNGLYGCRQRNAGENRTTTEQELNKAIDIHRRILDADDDDEVDLTWEEVKLVCTCIFTTIECCVNCPVWIDKCGCYHMVGVRYQEGESWVTVRQQQAGIRDVIQSSNKKKTRKSRSRKSTGFTARQPGKTLFILTATCVYPNRAIDAAVSSGEYAGAYQLHFFPRQIHLVVVTCVQYSSVCVCSFVQLLRRSKAIFARVSPSTTK